MTRADLLRLLSELRRRRVFRTAVVYAVVAWLLIQVAATIAPPLQLPGWSVSLLIVLALFGFPLALVLSWGFDLTPDGVVRAPGAAASTGEAGEAAEAGAAATAILEPPGVTAAPAAIPGSSPLDPAAGDGPSIAVLPFVNMSTDPEQEYFSDGITEEILNVLSANPRLRVAARTSAFAFKGKQAPVDEIGARLGVGHVLEGSVRRAGERVRITAQLVESRTGFHLWSRAFDRELCDVFAVQDEIAAAIADALRCSILGEPERAARRAPASEQAHALYLRGRYQLNLASPESLRRALEYFEQALRLDPEYAAAHMAVAETWFFMADSMVPPLDALPPARAALARALELDPQLPGAAALQGGLEVEWGWNWASARDALDRALATSPSDARAHLFSSFYWWVMGDVARAVEEARRAELLDPLSAYVSFVLEFLLLWSGDPEAALEQDARTQEIAPGFVYHDTFAAEALAALGRTAEAFDRFAHAEAVLGRPSSGRAVLLARTGRTRDAAAVAAELAERYDSGCYIAPEFVARVHVALGDHDAAFEWLRRGVRVRSSLAVGTGGWPDFAPVHDDPRFTALRREMGLPGVSS